MRDGYRVSSTVQGEWDASSIPREVWGEWVRLFLGDVKDHQTSRVFLSPTCPALIVTMYVFCTLAHSRKVRDITSVFSMDNDFPSVSSDVGFWVRLVNKCVFSKSGRVSGRTARGSLT